MEGGECAGEGPDTCSTRSVCGSSQEIREFVSASIRLCEKYQGSRGCKSRME